jgi:hypothetical protein
VGGGARGCARATALIARPPAAAVQRIPASFSGVYGFKPTPTRITSMGVRTPSVYKYRGQEMIRSVAGPMARCVDDLVLVMLDVARAPRAACRGTRVTLLLVRARPPRKAWLQPKMWAADPLTPRLPFRDEVYKGVGRSPAKLRVGVFEDDGWCVCRAARMGAHNPGMPIIGLCGAGMGAGLSPSPVLGAPLCMRGMRCVRRGLKSSILLCHDRTT